jgi:hypothetical protein
MAYDFETLEGQRTMRLNVMGMSLILRLLDRHDVVDWDDADVPEDPDIEDLEAWRREWDARQAVWHAARQAAGRRRVPAAKFRTNGDWLVFPAECRLIADTLRNSTPADAAAVTDDYDSVPRHPNLTINWGDDRVRDLIESARLTADYAEAAAGLGGFRVR